MRDSHRIKPYCDTLASIWSMVPDWRFSQLMVNALNSWVDEYGTDPFYAEDEEFLNFMSEYINKENKDA